ncbi:MAG TPA: bifunctional DNA-formamidopyrimidine glycosylase/DNA-(apurinic or apyrimidinic site) lyase [Candidatus Cybelea sp.]|nr:bifunctional DNA-formamidopyrimidine glycosylase/DNA-(apurinic or apyrimidinic site) lyase [Candidatus Cybelea sp.]
MPELPEVETIVRGLQRAIAGKRIAGADVRLARMIVAPCGVDFKRAVAGQRIAQTRRRGKYAVIELESGDALVVSLRMTGRLVVGAAAGPPYPGAQVVLRFTDGARLHFADVRTFGRMQFVKAGESWGDRLGTEPLSSGFTAEAFIGMLAGRTSPIKTFLLDQRRIAGVGNIYACEALWKARIRPTRQAGALTKAAARRLREAIVDVLQRAIEMRGTSVDDYVDAEGLKGGFQNNLSVYGRHGQTCPRCGTGRIVRTVIGGRGTWWCRRCQR